jgi:ElaB/YqjD/DUF883 family membrane-anchored ribosome-binding protein
MQSEDKPTGIPKEAPPPEGHAYAQREQQGPPPERAAYAPPQRQDIEYASREQPAGESISETVDEARQRVREQAEAGREKSAEGMEQAAGEVRERLGHREDMAGKAAGTAADSLERTAGYMRTHDTHQMMDDLERYVREHPYQAMAGALAAGFILSRVLR